MTPPIKMIGFIIPNRSSRLPLDSFAVPVDEVERITGMNFFERMDDLLENILEANCNFNAWK